MPIQVTANEYKPHQPARWYAATITKIEPVEGQHGAQIKWYFDVDEDDEGREQFAWCSQKLSSKSKLWEWFQGLTGRTPANGETVDVEQFVGKRVALMFRLENRDGQVFDRVEKLVAYETAFPPAVQTSTDGIKVTAEDDVPF